MGKSLNEMMAEVVAFEHEIRTSDALAVRGRVDN